MSTKVSIEISKTINLGNFNSLRVQAGMEATIEPNQTVVEAYNELYFEVSNNLKTIINKEMGLLPEEEKEIKKSSSGSRWRTPTVPE